MSILQAVILGIVQGLTEFLPVSSSAHLVLVPFLLNWQMDPEIAFIFDVIVQVGTLAAVIVYFWRDLVEIASGFIRGLLNRQPFATASARQGWFLILATFPAGILGLLIKDQVEAAFASPAATALFLLGTAALLAIAEFFNKRTTDASTASEQQITWLDALMMGFGQALSIFPGISRSGATITAGMLRGLNRSTAARFSFLMSVPVMLAAGALAALDLIAQPTLNEAILPVAAGFIAAAITGYAAIAWFLRYLTRHSLVGFSVYCAIAGVINLVVFWLRG